LVEKIKPRVLHPITFYESRAVFEYAWKNIVQPDRPKIKYRVTIKEIDSFTICAVAERKDENLFPGFLS
jgi:hypothetical protein